MKMKLLAESRTKQFIRIATYATSLLVSFILPSLSAAKNDFKNPTIFNTYIVSRMALYENCSLLTVYSTAKRNGSLYTQKGVGWVVRSDEGYRVLTPSHVVAGADSVEARCNNRVLPLHIQSQSQTLDISLLAIDGAPQAQESLFPLILFEDRKEYLKSFDKETAKDLKWHTRDQFSKSWDKILSAQVKTFYRAPMSNDEERQYGTTLFEGQELSGESQAKTVFDNSLNALRINSIAITPGFSGSPAYVTNTGDFSRKEGMTSDDELLVGMLTKTEINGTRSMGISLPQILSIMPALLATNDPTQDVYTTMNRLPVRLAYKLVPTAKSLERYQVLIDERDPNNKTIYSEVCNDSAAASSEWNISKTLSPAKEIVDQKNLQPPKNTKSETIKSSKNSATTEPSEKKTKLSLEPNKSGGLPASIRYQEQKLGGGDYGEGGGGAATNSQFDSQFLIYKAGRTCKKSYIASDKGGSFDSIQMNGQTVKTTNVYELFNAWIFRTPGSQQICQSTGFIPKQDRYSYTDGATTLRAYGTRIPLMASTEQFIACKGDGFLLTATTGSIGITGDFTKPDAPYAVIYTQKCKNNVEPSNYYSVNRWKKSIRTKNFDVDITFGNFGEYLSVKTLRISPECTQDGISAVHEELIIK